MKYLLFGWFLHSLPPTNNDILCPILGIKCMMMGKMPAYYIKADPKSNIAGLKF